MTTTQFLLIIGTIYIAPHIPYKISLSFGCILLIVATLLNLIGRI